MPKPPKVDFSRIPKEIVVKKGEKIEIDVPFVGTPRPEAQWARDGKPLSDRDTDIETKDKNSKLCIPHSERSDAGLYELTLTNEVGTEKVPVNVIVKGELNIIKNVTFSATAVTRKKRKVSNKSLITFFFYL